MTRLATRKTRLNLVTEATARYRSKERAIIVEVHPDYATIRLAGTRTRFELSWRGIYDYAAQVAANHERAKRKEERLAKRKERIA